MSDPTGTPTASQLADALNTLADLAGTLYVREPDGLTIVQILAHETDERDRILTAMRRTLTTAQTVGAGQLHTWTGHLAGWQLHLVQWLPTLAPAAAGQPAEADPGTCCCWLTSRNGCPVHHLADEMADDERSAPVTEPHTCDPQWCVVHCAGHLADQDDDLTDSRDRAAAAWAATVDTSPATAAAEQPAGPVSAWPLTVPAPRPPADMLPTPSWALVGLESVFAPLVHPGPLTDPALAGRPAPAAAGGLVTLGELTGAPDWQAPISPGGHIAPHPAGSIVTLAEVRDRRNGAA